MKRKAIIILLSISLLFSLSGCHRKHFISGTFYSDDYDGRTYQFVADGGIKSNGVEPMSYEYISGNKFILHIDKADLLCEYIEELSTITYKYDGLEYHLYDNYVTAEKSRAERGYTAISETALEPLNREDYRQEEEEKKPEEQQVETIEPAPSNSEKKEDEKEETPAFDIEKTKAMLQGTWEVKDSELTLVIKDDLITQVSKDKDGKETKASYELIITEKTLSLKPKKGKATSYEYSIAKDGKELTLIGTAGSTIYVKK